ncbi:hypothetical protein H0H81_007286, partial [Sphagnurus paluster]
EVACAIVFAFNVLEGVYAVKYPRTPTPPTPARSKALFNTPGTPTNKRAFKVLSPHSSPQPQKPFSMSTSMSQSASFSGSPSKYPTSPLSTPSRVVHYPTVPGSTNTQASSTSMTMTMMSPSPVVKAYRGRHAAGVGRALDDSILGRIPRPESDDDE